MTGRHSAGRRGLLWLATACSACGPGAPVPRSSPAASVATAPAAPPETRRPVATAPQAPYSFVVDVLSRGKGVPAQARERMQQLRAYVDADRGRGVPVSVSTTRLGIEGETRMCVEYRTADAGARAYEHARSLMAGVELANVRRDGCTEKGKQEERKR